MKCLILAAGYATRLYPLTENFPKPLLEVSGRTILDWLVDDIVSAGEVESFAVVSNHRFCGHFEDWVSRRTGKMPFVVLDDGTVSNETRFGAVMDIQFAVNSLCIDDDLLVIAGDNLLDFSLAGFISYFRSRKSSCVMRYFEPDTDRLRKCGVLEVDESDRILSMEEKPSEPRSHWCCPPFYLLAGNDLGMVGECISSGCGTDAPGSLVAWMSARTAVYAMEMPGKRYDIGDLRSYRAVCDNYKGKSGI